MTRLFDTPPKLTSNQSLILELVRLSGHTRAIDAGLEIHAAKNCQHCKWPGDGTYWPCAYAERSGRQVLEALKRKGLLKRDRHHIYRRADQPSSQTNTFPAGY